MSDLDYEVVKIRSISHYLNILTKKYPNTNENSERFYRGLSSEKYVSVDYPSIYRSKKETLKVKNKDVTIEYDPYIKYEDKIFHDVIAKSPEDFNKCENTFEYLVKMQHYGTPTRLLDVTSNPLIALYFACTNGDGSISSDKDGAIVMYDVPQSNIKNFNSDTVTILSNLARINEEYIPFFSKFNAFMKYTKQLLNNGVEFKHYDLIDTILDKFDTILNIFETLNKNNFSEKVVLHFTFLSNLKDSYKSKRNQLSSSIRSHYNKNKSYFHIQTPNENTLYMEMERVFNAFVKQLQQIEISTIDTKFNHLIQEEKPYFIHENIIPEHLSSVYCVKPKFNNPRIVNQNGAFLIFGFASLADTKLTTPTQHFKYKPLNHDKNKFLHIKISKNQKKELVNQLRLLGVDRAFIYPEIENIAKVITDKYTIQKTEN